ncbi:T9SS-dependent choice-of-anchor J family protein [Chryseobacterium koreense]|nr:choice-of-anchor J domain-containing protein [Chryseobacterium koreense]MBB5334580.1 hypothetical protein [Chryseobacterium koreense]
MKKILLIASLVAIPFFGNGQIFQENFDGQGPGIGAWTVIDNDGLTPAANVSFISNGWNRIDRQGANGNFGGPAGNFAAMSTSWYNPAGTSDDWLITPQIALPSQAAFLQWDSKAQDPAYRDGYKVMLAPNGGNTIADFTVTLFTISQENSDWITRQQSLAPYAGTTVRIAFVNNSNDMFMLLMDNISVQLSPTAPPNCPTLTSPANAATGISYLSPVNLSWSAPTGGEPVSSYDVFFGTSANPTTLLTNVTATSASVPTASLAPSTTYYWRVEAKNGAGNSTGCSERTFTTMANPAAPYCGPLVFSFVEPITNVTFAGINNTSSAATSSAAHEFFLDKIANVTAGGTYTLSLQGYTGGNYNNKFYVFIDWNQNGNFNDPGEAILINGTLTNSTGSDGKTVTQDIVIPADATIGNTRMRIKKTFSTAYPDPCTNGSSFGQAEDYTVNIASLAVSDVTKAQTKVYPNPVVDVLNIDAASKVNSVSVYDLSGKVVSTHLLNSAKSQINLAKLAPGAYMVKIDTENGPQTVKIVKE